MKASEGVPLRLALELSNGSTAGSRTAMTTVKTSPSVKDRGSARQTNSCAECRRLKLKCSRVWPCDNCEKRGCAQICPKGEMVTGKGKRSIIAGTEELHQRIAELETALAQIHARTSSSPHPLLSSAYLFAPRDGSRPYPARPGRGDHLTRMPEEDDVIDSAFGTLTIGQEGQARFVGSLAGSEYLREEVSSPEEADSPARPNTVDFYGSGRLVTPPPSGTMDYPSAEGGVRTAYADGGVALLDSFVAGGSGIFDVEKLRAQLPKWEAEGRDLAQSYWDNVNWMYQIVPRPMFDHDYLMNAYDPTAVPNPHKLAVVFLIMAIGVMFDLTRQPFDARGERLFVLGRACLNLVGLEHASIATVQSLHLCGTFIMNDKHGNGAEIFWPILGANIKISLSLGLHRDGSAFGLSEEEAEERRLVWWEVVTYDRLQALCFGRPCGTSHKSMDTKIPTDGALVADKDGYHRAKFELIQLMEKVIDVQTQVAPVTYTVIQQLDTEFMEFKKSLPDTLLPNIPIQDLPLDRLIHPHLVIHRLGIRLLVAQSRLLLNRPSFTRALRDNPDDPSRSKHGSSFVALYESAQEIVQLVKQLVIYHPSLIARWWFFWFHAFSSAVCLAAIAIRAPGCAFASPAFHGMTIVCDISAAAREGCRAKKGLPILLRLRKRAAETLHASNLSKSKARTKKDDGETTEEDDLSHLMSTAKLRRVVNSPPLKRTGTGNAPQQPPPPGAMADSSGTPQGILGTPSPRSAQSVATSLTLADTVYEGAVPPFPGATGAESEGNQQLEGYGQPVGALFGLGSGQADPRIGAAQVNGPTAQAAGGTFSPGALWLNHLSPSSNATGLSGFTWANTSPNMGTANPNPMSGVQEGLNFTDDLSQFTSFLSGNNSGGGFNYFGSGLIDGGAGAGAALQPGSMLSGQGIIGEDEATFGGMQMDMDMSMALGMDRAGYEEAVGHNGGGAEEWDFETLFGGMGGA